MRGWAWTAADDAVLRASYATMTAEQIGERLGRSLKAVEARAAVLGLRKNRKRPRAAAADEPAPKARIERPAPGRPAPGRLVHRLLW